MLRSNHWFFSATAFYQSATVGITTTNTIWWYFQRLYIDQQQIAEVKYQFQADGPLTSYAVSPDAPQLCMTVKTATGTSLYLDDVSQAATQLHHRILCPSQNIYQHHSPDYELVIGLKRYEIANKDVLCRAINTQMETVSNTWGIDNQFNFFGGMCQLITTILLEEKETGKIHFVRIIFDRAATINNSIYTPWVSNCRGEKPFIGGTTKNYIQYSYQLPLPLTGPQILTLHHKNFLNYGYEVPGTLVAENSATNDQQLSFYVAGIRDGNIFFDTNNLLLRCKPLNSNLTLDLVISDYLAIAGDYRAESLSVTSSDITNNPLFRYVPHTATSPSPYQLLTLVTPNSLVDSHNFNEIVFDVANQMKQPLEQKVKYEWRVCAQPLTFGIDPKIQKGLLCLEINSTLQLNPMMTQGKNLNYSGSSSVLKNMDLNLWPYSNCWDRSSNPLHSNGSAKVPSRKQTIDFFFSGKIGNSVKVKQRIQENTIRFQFSQGVSNTTNVDDIIQIDFFSIEPGTFGLQEYPLRFIWQIGADSAPAEWTQATMFQYSCQPQDLVWQTRQSNRAFPLQLTYFYGQGPMKIDLPTVIPTNSYNYRDIDKNVYLQYNFTALFSSATQPTTNMTLANVTIVNNAFVIDQNNGTQQWLMIGAKAVSVEPYYYVRKLDGKVMQSQIDINLTKIANVSFVYNTAPTFASELQNVELTVNDTMLIRLPNIIDPDSDKAYIWQLMTFSSAKFVKLQNSKLKYNNNLTISPTKNSDAGDYLCQLTLIDVGPSPRKNAISFRIKVNKLEQKQVIMDLFVPETAVNITFETERGLRIKVDKVFTNATVCLKFTYPMESYLNPLYTEDSNRTTNISSVLYHYVQITHKHLDLYTKLNRTMAAPDFQVISFDGLNMFIQFVFPPASEVSESPTESSDYISMRFNETAVFVSKNQRIAQENYWLLEFKLPTQQPQIIMDMAQKTTDTMTGLMTANFIINLIMSTSLQKMWGNMNVLQLVVATPLLQVNMPQNANILCLTMLSITKFEIFDATALTDKLFGRDRFAPETLESMNDRLESNGYAMINFIYNQGTMFYIAGLTVSLFIVASLFQIVQLRLRSPRLGRLLQKVWAKLTPNVLIRLFFEIIFDLGICSYIQLNYLTHVTTAMDGFSNALAIVGAALCFLVPIQTAYILHQLHRQKILHQESTIKKYGELYEQQLVPTPTLMHIFYNFFFMFRRLATIFCIFAFQSLPSFQMGVMMLMTTFWMGYSLSTKPFEDPVLNRMEVFNETMYNLILLLCFTFTELLPDISMRTETGYLFIVLLLTLLLVNIGVQIKDTVIRLIMKFKRFMYRHKQRQERWGKSQLMNGQTPSNRKFNHVLKQEYKNRMRNDIICEFRQVVTNTIRGKTVAHPPSTLLNVKTKKFKPTNKSQNQVYSINENTQYNKAKHLQPRSSTEQRTSLRRTQANELSDEAIVDQFLFEEEQKQKLRVMDAQTPLRIKQKNILRPKLVSKPNISQLGNQTRQQQQQMTMNAYMTKKKESEAQRDQLMKQIEMLEMMGVLDKYMDHGHQQRNQ